MSRLKQLFLAMLSTLTGRHAVLLPSEARGSHEFTVEADYRVSESVNVELQLPEGRLRIHLLGYDGHFPRRGLWSSPSRPVTGKHRVSIDLKASRATLDGEDWGQWSEPVTARRFAIRWEYRDSQSVQTTLTGHYQPPESDVIDRRYFEGDAYVDHDAEASGEPEMVLELLTKYRHATPSPVLEIGCATGGMIAALLAHGYDTYGIDISEWALEQATTRLGPERVFRCDLSVESLPRALEDKGPFHTVILWAVLEHFDEPFEILGRLAPHLSEHALLLINTTNADSLTHQLFGEDWEGYFDWTHHGVRHLTPTSLRDGLASLGFEILHCTTDHVWDGSASPTHATLRDWWDHDSRFRRLIRSKELGDFLVLVARKSGHDPSSLERRDRPDD